MDPGEESRSWISEPLVEKTRGGSARGGAALSEAGRRVLALYREMESVSRTAIRDPLGKLTLLLKE